MGSNVDVISASNDPIIVPGNELVREINKLYRSQNQQKCTFQR